MPLATVIAPPPSVDGKLDSLIASFFRPAQNGLQNVTAQPLNPSTTISTTFLPSASSPQSLSNARVPRRGHSASRVYGDSSEFSMRHVNALPATFGMPQPVSTLNLNSAQSVRSLPLSSPIRRGVSSIAMTPSITPTAAILTPSVVASRAGSVAQHLSELSARMPTIPQRRTRSRSPSCSVTGASHVPPFGASASQDTYAAQHARRTPLSFTMAHKPSVATLTATGGATGSRWEASELVASLWSNQPGFTATENVQNDASDQSINVSSVAAFSHRAPFSVAEDRAAAMGVTDSERRGKWHLDGADADLCSVVSVDVDEDGMNSTLHRQRLSISTATATMSSGMPAMVWGGEQQARQQPQPQPHQPMSLMAAVFQQSLTLSTQQPHPNNTSKCVLRSVSPNISTTQLTARRRSSSTTTSPSTTRGRAPSSLATSSAKGRAWGVAARSKTPPQKGPVARGCSKTRVGTASPATSRTHPTNTCAKEAPGPATSAHAQPIEVVPDAGSPSAAYGTMASPVQTTPTFGYPLANEFENGGCVGVGCEGPRTIDVIPVMKPGKLVADYIIHVVQPATPNGMPSRGGVKETAAETHARQEAQWEALQRQIQNMQSTSIVPHQKLSPTQAHAADNGRAASDRVEDADEVRGAVVSPNRGMQPQSGYLNQFVDASKDYSLSESDQEGNNRPSFFTTRTRASAATDSDRDEDDDAEPLNRVAISTLSLRTSQDFAGASTTTSAAAVVPRRRGVAESPSQTSIASTALTSSFGGYHGHHSHPRLQEANCGSPRGPSEPAQDDSDPQTPVPFQSGQIAAPTTSYGVVGSRLWGNPSANCGSPRADSASETDTDFEMETQHASQAQDDLRTRALLLIQRARMQARSVTPPSGMSGVNARAISFDEESNSTTRTRNEGSPRGKRRSSTPSFAVEYPTSSSHQVGDMTYAEIEHLQNELERAKAALAKQAVAMATGDGSRRGMMGHSVRV